MPQMQLPFFPEGLTLINRQVGIEKKEGRVYYFHGHLPVFSHAEDDDDSFRFIISHLVVGGNVKQVEIVKAFGVSAIRVKRSVKQLREQGPRGFFSKRKSRSAHVLVPEMLEKAQRLLSKGDNPATVAKKLDQKADTIRKAIKSGRLRKKKSIEGTKGEESVNETTEKAVEAKTKSDRAVEDGQASLGIGCTREAERTLAACGQLESASPVFEAGLDVRSAGVLVALPSLLVNGLLKFSKEHFSLPKGFYGLESLMVIFAFLALLRVKSLEKVQEFDPGELGKLVGLDRIPEVKILREKLKFLSEKGNPADWSRELGKFWMEADPGLAGILYIDGHVRVYHGKQTKLPKRYVSREKLCLRGVTDYWVNDSLGSPFFVVTKTVNSGLLSTLERDIIPRLLKDVPNQPTEEELEANKYLFRFGIVFDREGFSQFFFKKMWKDRIACYTYRKNVKDVWPESEFVETEVIFPNGEKAKMKLAERGLYYPEAKIWVREIRKLKESGHQTSLVTTDFFSDTARIAGTMFARWSQENFFKYMMEHYGIDKLIDYQLEKMDETTKVINPRHRELESQIRSMNAKLCRRKAEYGALIYGKEIEEKKIQGYIRKKAMLIEAIEDLEREIKPLKALKKDTNKHIPFSDLPEAEKFKNLKKCGKQFIDTIKMIAYRSETALVNVLRSYIPKKDEARALARQIFVTDADIEPDKVKETLRIRIHNMTNPRFNRYARKLCELLNESETIFPGTNLRLHYDLVSSEIPVDQVI